MPDLYPLLDRLVAEAGAGLDQNTTIAPTIRTTLDDALRLAGDAPSQEHSPLRRMQLQFAGDLHAYLAHPSLATYNALRPDLARLRQLAADEETYTVQGVEALDRLERTVRAYLRDALSRDGLEQALQHAEQMTAAPWPGLTTPVVNHQYSLKLTARNFINHGGASWRHALQDVLANIDEVRSALGTQADAAPADWLDPLPHKPSAGATEAQALQTLEQAVGRFLHGGIRRSALWTCWGAAGVARERAPQAVPTALCDAQRNLVQVVAVYLCNTEGAHGEAGGLLEEAYGAVRDARIDAVVSWDAATDAPDRTFVLEHIATEAAFYLDHSRWEDPYGLRAQARLHRLVELLPWQGMTPPGVLACGNQMTAKEVTSQVLSPILDTTPKVSAFVARILAERTRQRKHFDAREDEGHDGSEWITIMVKYLGMAADAEMDSGDPSRREGRTANQEYAHRLVQVGALVLAALEAHDGYE